MRCKCGNEKHFDFIWFIESEVKYSNGMQIKTGRKRKAVSHVVCLECGCNICVDDSFDGEWTTQ